MSAKLLPGCVRTAGRVAAIAGTPTLFDRAMDAASESSHAPTRPPRGGGWGDARFLGP